MTISDREKEILLILADGPKWGKDIAEHIGMTLWSQIATGTYYGKKLAAKGLAERKMMRGEPFGKYRIYFIITDEGRRALGQGAD